MRAIKLARFNDVVYVNAFVARSPRQGRLVYKTSRLAGLWQLDLEDLERGGRWSVGYYIDGVEDRVIEYDVAIRLEWGGYVNEELDSTYVLWLSGDSVNIALPHEYDSRVAITAPRVCGHVNALLEPVYIWRSLHYYVLDCAGDLRVFKTFEELVNWIREQKCTEGHDVIHWLEWYVLPDVEWGEEEWSDVVGRGIAGRPNPTSDDVIKLVQKYLAS
ncbi:MAG: hypothetical protein ACO2PN_24045 [Pyrobaculum sp.]|jgi:hypothetical protein